MAEPAPGIELRECPPRGRIDLRGDPADRAFATGVSSVLGLEPPPTPNTSRPGAESFILWLGPDQWLIEVAHEAQTGIANTLESALSALHASVAIVGDGYATLSLAGKRAADVLAKGMTLDLDPDRFLPGCCARSLLAKVPVLLHRPGDDLFYEVTVARSYSDYAWRWLDDAALEYRYSS